MTDKSIFNQDKIAKISEALGKEIAPLLTGARRRQEQAPLPESSLLPPEGAESTENFSNRIFPLEQGHVQDAVDKLFESWASVSDGNATEEAYALDGQAHESEPEPEKIEPKDTRRRLRFGPWARDEAKNNG